MAANILLEDEQKELLSTLVEGSRNLPREKRERFYFVRTDRGQRISSGRGEVRHPHIGRVVAYQDDLEVFIRWGLIAPSYDSDLLTFSIAPEGFAYYEKMKREMGQPVQQVESTVKGYIDADDFQRRYPQAYQKWSEAETLLWSSDSNRQFTTIGHLCREAMQEFAAALVDKYQPPSFDQDKTHTVARIRAVLKTRADQLGSTEKPFLDALLAYWGTISDLVQRQEHGSQKEGEPLIWEDGRRVIFQTAVVMFEIDKSLKDR